jgi:Holliday junction resolvase RusA-like endonuclease
VTLIFTVPGEPHPCGRPRFNRKSGNVYTPKESLIAQADVAAAAIEAHVRNRGLMLVPDPDHDWRITARFTLGHDRRRKGDIDNLLKTVLDGLTGVVWADDGQVISVIADKSRALPGEQPRTEVTVSPRTRSAL